MTDFSKILLSFFLSGFVGVFVSYFFQRKNAKSQIVYKRAERQADELKMVRDKFEQLSSERIYYARLMILSLKSNTLTELDRQSYRKAVVSWNKSLNRFFLDLNAQNLYSIALEIESSVQENFIKSHSWIRERVEKKVVSFRESDNAVEALKSLDLAYARSKEVTLRLTVVVDQRWDDVQFADTVLLSAANVKHASTMTLIFALFHKAPHRLRISRPCVDG
ncbi:hypothetical protein [Pseudomonas avellanae]|uniref:hypothetical protein n=1 Tax=Pseudomonas avellanae TaxID=46257 RepID=UPI00118664B8|nr:hypothetical protein [Pseudomonas avellanae]